MELPTIEAMTSNILTVWARASERERAEGEVWYLGAHDLAAVLAESRGARGRGRSRKVTTWAGIIAALSPQVAWETNIRLATEVAREGEALGGTFGLNVAKANAILASPHVDPLTVTFTAPIRGADREVKALSGDKVTAFYKLIANPDDVWTVCVDRHAVAIAFGRTLDDRERNNLLRPRKRGPSNYELIADAYRLAAARVNVLPHQVQAVAWVVWRNELLNARKEA